MDLPPLPPSVVTDDSPALLQRGSGGDTLPRGNDDDLGWRHLTAAAAGRLCRPVRIRRKDGRSGSRHPLLTAASSLPLPLLTAAAAGMALLPRAAPPRGDLAVRRPIRWRWAAGAADPAAMGSRSGGGVDGGGRGDGSSAGAGLGFGIFFILIFFVC